MRESSYVRASLDHFFDLALSFRFLYLFSWILLLSRILLLSFRRTVSAGLGERGRGKSARWAAAVEWLADTPQPGGALQELSLDFNGRQRDRHRQADGQTQADSKRSLHTISMI